MTTPAELKGRLLVQVQELTCLAGWSPYVRSFLDTGFEVVALMEQLEARRKEEHLRLREVLELLRTDTRDPRIPCDIEQEALDANDLWTEHLEAIFKEFEG